MPLPTSNQPWPPPQIADLATRHREWDAWYTGDPTKLRAAYQHAPTGRITRPAQYAGGIVGAAARLWWGKPTPTGGTTSREQLHIPLARDIATTSADLLYADPPKIHTEHEATDKRLSEYMDDGWAAELAAGAEIGAALGARFMRVTWDRELLDRPFLTTIHADDVIPEFRFGRLSALTVSTVVRKENHQVWRWLERHELVDGDGLIFHGLYLGTDTHLGQQVPLTDDPATAGLATVIDADGALTEGRTPGLAVVHVPNRTPAPEWRKHQIGRYLGTSDYSAITGLMDALDETWSSWMRDIRLGKARILAAEAMFDFDEHGRAFNYDREVFELVTNVLPDENNQMPIEQVQFNIRVAEHAATADALTKKIIEQAGYSLQSFGEHIEDTDITATEVRAREKKSIGTRDRKIRHERPALMELARKMLLIDQAVFGTSGIAPDVSIKVDFPDSVQSSTEAVARTVQMLRTAQVLSIETGVQMAHPDWAPETVAVEVARIMDEQQVADPFDRLPGTGPGTPVTDDEE